MKWYDEGKPLYQSTGKTEKREALALLRRTEAATIEGQREGPAVSRIKFEDLVEGLRRDYQLKGHKSWRRREEHLTHLREDFKARKVKTITTNHLQAYVTRRLGEGAANATINRELDCLHRMMVLGQRQTPPVVIRIPHFPKLAENNVREGFFEHEEFLAFRGAACDHLKVASTIAYYTGLRKGEIITANGLRWDEHVDLRDNCLRLRSRQTKTKQPRVVYMEGDFLRIIRKAKEVRDRNYPACPYVCQLNVQPVTDIKKAWKTACKRIGLEGKTFHDLRRTGVRNLIRAGVPEVVAMKISGHKTRSVFDRYNITNEEDLKQAAGRLSEYIRQKEVTISVTLAELNGPTSSLDIQQPVDTPACFLEPASGIEPPTCGLRNRCSAN